MQLRVDLVGWWKVRYLLVCDTRLSYTLTKNIVSRKRFYRSEIAVTSAKLHSLQPPSGTYVGAMKRRVLSDAFGGSGSSFTPVLHTHPPYVLPV